MAEFRVDPETGDWNIVAPLRANRPVDRSPSAANRCPFCPGNESLTPPQVLVVPPDGPWRVRVVPNLYAVVSPAEPQTQPTAAGQRTAATMAGSPPWDTAGAATGQHEVVIESPDHHWNPRSASPDALTEVLWAVRERCRVMARRGAAAVVVFRNHGRTAGASLPHPHLQIVALDQAPPGLVRRWHTARRHFQDTGRRLHDDIAAAERAYGLRVVADADHVLVYQPWAAGVPDETVLVPADASADLAGASDEALAATARALPRVLAALAAVRDDPPYNLVVHAGPANDGGAAAWYRWHVGVYPRTTVRAGLELATGLGVNPTSPEQTAAALREAMATEPA